MSIDLRYVKDRCREDGDCWIWTGHSNGDGFPKIRTRSARRVCWEVVYGHVPKGNVVGLSCGRKDCLNPEHLILTDRSRVSKKSNARPDVKAKRSAASAKTMQAKVGVITMDIARYIRSSDKSGVDLADELHISVSLVSKVRLNKAWIDRSNPFRGLSA